MRYIKNNKKLIIASKITKKSMEIMEYYNEN